ncbi:tRNA epoxyqueuosine(34) reductase QueG [Amylibacter kogurei]|uniref:tRNA epoxyqueuosine(34) reductase QueG n=2 Tax=Paramylibacter kogurei TaxID=1889778 RepID=A0A2G5K3H7_9RHOB|nr:tRNA epoxyqueuosine(34) reductase QueG [Amylibacter kogurei]
MGICAPDAIPLAPARLAEFVDAGMHGQMAWMADRMHWRGNPAELWPEAKSVIMLAEPYTPEHDPLDILQHPDRAAISVYAQNRDYHDMVKKRLKRLGRWLIEQAAGTEIKVFVDTAPVMEKPLGAAAGLGWQGKHTNLVGRDLGSWFFLGAIFTTVDFAKDTGEVDHCGSCRACLDVCPTDAFPAPYRLDARRCISYLTIEHKGPVDVDLRPLLGNRIYGCDDCLAVCPWNKFATEARDIGYTARSELTAPKLTELAMLDDAQFRTLFSKNPIKRIGRNQFIRNVLYAIGNSGDAGLRDVAKRLISDGDETVVDAANWALSELERTHG